MLNWKRNIRIKPVALVWPLLLAVLVTVTGTRILAVEPNKDASPVVAGAVAGNNQFCLGAIPKTQN